MIEEHRSADRRCPDCGTHPIVRENGDIFCDLCNKYREASVLVG
jgi:uncharacterized Zn finger protein (UPF0148 family)